MSAATIAYVNPLAKAKNVRGERIDQGVDYHADPGSPILALGPGVITAIMPDFYAGQPSIIERLTGGPLAGQYEYYAEQLTPGVHTGQTVKAGDQIATVAASGTGLELGIASGPTGQPYAQTHGGYIEGRMTAAGQAENALLRVLGAPAGTTQPGAVLGTSPFDPVKLKSVFAGSAQNPANDPGAVSQVTGAVGGVIGDAISAVFSGFFDFIKQGLLKGALYAVLVGGGIALAGYGLVRSLEGTGARRKIGMAKLAAEAE